MFVPCESRFFMAGSQEVSIGLLGSKNARSFRLECIRSASYVKLAKAYREQAKKQKNLVTLKQKLRRNPEVKKLFGAAEFKPFVCIRWMRKSEDGELNETVRSDYTEEDCLALLRRLHNVLEIPKALFVLAGWIHRGYDNQHPDIFPAAPEIGGDEGVQRISRLARSYDYLFGLHDNYQDLYEDAPSWNESILMMNPDGIRRKGGVWAGGQAWLIASNSGLELAKRNLPQVMERYSPNAYFIDTTFAAPLYQSYDPANPLALEDDMLYKENLSQYAADLFGVFGSELGVEFGVPSAHYFEGIMSREFYYRLAESQEPGTIPIPLFSLVYHDCVAAFTHQSDRANLGDARLILRHLARGAMPLYYIEPHRYWEKEIEEPDLSNPDYCFVRGEGGWGENRHPRERFIKNTYSFLSPFAEGVADQSMTDHQYLKDDCSVERSKFGQDWSVIVNYGPEDYLFGQTLLPPMGFVATGPDFLAQHYYPNAESKKTCLLVKQGDDLYYGFR